VLVDGPVQIPPLAADLDVCLVDPDRAAVRLAEGAQPALDQGRVGQDPAVQGGVVDLQAALQKQLLDVAIAERIAQIPRDGLQDQRCLEVAALEIVLTRRFSFSTRAFRSIGHLRFGGAYAARMLNAG
jgi:hypothetical protein